MTDRAWLAELSVDGHLGAERGDVVGAGEFGCEFLGDQVCPVDELLFGLLEESVDLFIRQSAREFDGREFRGVENLVAVGVADAVEQSWIGEDALECVVFGFCPRGEVFEGAGEDIQTTTIELSQFVSTLDDMHRRALLWTRFYEMQSSVLEIERCQSDLTDRFLIQLG